MKTSNIYNKLLLLAGLALMCSCKKFVTIDGPKNQLTTSEVFADSSNANGAILGIYIKMSGFVTNISSGGVTLFTGLSSDELYSTFSDIDNDEFYNDLISIRNSSNALLWSDAYNKIYATNACIEGIEKSNGISERTKKSLIGEVKFIRAFIYFQLVNLYGQVPLVVTTDYDTNRLLGRTPIDKIYAQIISDLLYAKTNITATHFKNTRANSFTATALLAKVYLYHGDYEQSEIEATKVINSGNYNLMSNLNEVFLSSSNEVIWAMESINPGRQTAEGFTFNPSASNVQPLYVLTTSLLNSFELGDLRKVSWINTNIVNDQNYSYPYKYKTGNSTSSTASENYVMLRLAEQYLIRAEARAKQGKIVGVASASEDLEKIRNRAGLTNPFIGSSIAEMMVAIEKERRSELFCEWGNRWFDLKRNNRGSEVLGPLKPNWRSNSILYPIPSQEIAINPSLTQNDGY